MGLGIRRAGLMAAGVVLAVGAAMPAAMAVPAAGSSAPGWRLVKTFGCDGGFVRAITATGPRGAWAAGTTFCEPDEALIARWDGRSWHQLQPPQRFATFGAGNVAALSSTYAWTFPAGRFALLWNNGRWRFFRLSFSSLFPDFAAALSQSDAWVFMLQGSAFHFDGQAWHQVPIPVRPQAGAAPGPRDIWAVGRLVNGQGYGLGHWTGRRWHVTAFPDLHLPAGDAIYNTSVVSDNSAGAWVAADIGSPDFRHPVEGLLLLWTGNSWTQVAIPYLPKSIGPLAHDGHGGLWMAANFGSGVHMVHYSATGAWSATALSTHVYAVNSLRLIPGTSSVWAGAELYAAYGRSALIYKYGP